MKRIAAGRSKPARKALRIDPQAARNTRIAAALELIGDGLDALCDAGDKQMPGLVVIGLAELMRWAGRELKGAQNVPNA